MPMLDYRWVIFHEAGHQSWKAMEVDMPIGAVVVMGGRVIARAHNLRRHCRTYGSCGTAGNQEACEVLGTWRLIGFVCDLRTVSHVCRSYNPL